MGGAERPLVSVVVPTYNRPAYLRRAIASVADQTYEPIELIVVDDCSDVPVAENLDLSSAEGALNNSEGISSDAEGGLNDSKGYSYHVEADLNDYKANLNDDEGELDESEKFERVEVVRHEENRGGSAARNTGIREATGRYVALLDDDDQWTPEKVERQVDRLRRGDVGAVFTGGRVIDENGETKRVSRAPATAPKGPALTKRLLCRNVVGSCSVFMVEADAIESAGPFDERFPSWQDQEWYVRLSRYCEFETVEDPLVVYSEESPHRISDDVETVKNETYPLFVEKFEPMAAEYGRLFRRKMVAWATYRVGKALAMAGDIEEARSYLARAVSLYPFAPVFYKYLLPSIGGRVTYEAARKVQVGLESVRW